MTDKQLILRFTGNKIELHKQLKRWCLENEQSMNKTVIELIEQLLNSGE